MTTTTTTAMISMVLECILWMRILCTWEVWEINFEEPYNKRKIFVCTGKAFDILFVKNRKRLHASLRVTFFFVVCAHGMSVYCKFNDDNLFIIPGQNEIFN